MPQKKTPVRKKTSARKKTPARRTTRAKAKTAKPKASAQRRARARGEVPSLIEIWCHAERQLFLDDQKNPPEAFKVLGGGSIRFAMVDSVEYERVEIQVEGCNGSDPKKLFPGGEVLFTAMPSNLMLPLPTNKVVGDVTYKIRGTRFKPGERGPVQGMTGKITVSPGN